MKKKRRVKKMIVIITVIIAVIIAQTLPVFFPKPIGSKSIIDENINLYYQKGDEIGANEVFDLLKEKADSIRSLMKFESDVPTNVYLYKSQWQLAIREAGFATLIIAPSWYIGDSHNGNIMMVSPYVEIQSHNHDSILQATLHELVHSINFQINPEISYFWDNGLATYLSEQIPSDQELYSHAIPSIKDMHTENGLKFGQMGGYAFSYNYIKYLEATYGWDSIIDYTLGNTTYEEVFNKTEEEIYNDWVTHLESQNDSLYE